MRRSSPEQKVTAAYLALCPPHDAFVWLRDRAPKTAAETRRIGVFPEVSGLEEAVLLRRRDPLIDLGLARYGRTRSVVKRVFARGGSAVRIATWSNTSGSSFPTATGVFGDDRELEDLARAGEDAELQALARNPVIADRVLVDLLTRKEAFAALDDRRFRLALFALSENPRLKEDHDETHLDGWADHMHGKVFTRVWALAASLPAEEFWVHVLESLLRASKPPVGVKEEDVRALLARWRIDRPREEGRSYRPGGGFFVRSRIADLLEPDPSLATDSDIAVRLSYWRRFDPRAHPSWPDDLAAEAASQDDEMRGHDFIIEAVRNPALWRTEQLRQKLSTVCWGAPDKHHSMDMPNAYRKQEVLMRERHPDWFRDEVPEAITPSPAPTPPPSTGTGTSAQARATGRWPFGRRVGG